MLGQFTRLICLLILSIGQVSFSYATTTQIRPTVGVVLSGGGAKGAAHIGVLKVLEANNIPVDYIAGTSIGAYVAGLYALGYSAHEIEIMMLKANWTAGFSDSISRDNLSYRDKQQKDKFNIPLNLGYKDGGFRAPSGLLRGQTMSYVLRDATNLVQQFGDFDELAIPYRAVATDLATSEAVILRSGSVVEAMQASASVPGVVQPTELDGQLLVDGGISNNMPVDVVKAMGADIIIAVDISSPLTKKENLTNTIAVLEQLSTMLTNASTNKQKALLTENDIIIRPAIDTLGTTDFSIMPKALALGELAATQLLPQLDKLKLSDEDYAKYQNAKITKSIAWINPLQRPIVRIKVNNKSKVSKKLIIETLGLSAGDIVTKESLKKALDQVYALNKFARVDAEFTDTPEGRVLIVKTTAKSWGPNYFHAGFNWEDDFNLDSAVTLNLAYVMTELTENSGEWRNELELGDKKRIATEFYEPLNRNQDFYSRAQFQYELKDWDLIDSNSLIVSLESQLSRIELGLGYNYSQSGIIELGVLGEFGSIRNRGSLSADINYQSTGGYFKYAYDTLNSISFPTTGNRLRFGAYIRDESFVYDDKSPNGSSWQFEADWKGALQLGNHAVVGKVALATIDNNTDFTLHFSELGGFLNMSGYHKNALAGSHKMFGAFIYQYDLGRDLFISDLPWYLGVSLEGGNVWASREQIDIKDLIFGSSLYLGTDTDWGPAALGFGMSDQGEQAVYLFIGKNF